MSLIYKDLSPEDRNRLPGVLMNMKSRGMEYTTGNLFLYRSIYHPEIAWYEGGASEREKGVYTYSWPYGTKDPIGVIEQMEPDPRNGEFRLSMISSDDVEMIKNSKLAGEVESISMEPEFEYVYRASDLAHLPGKKYHSKRNFCTRFEKNNPGYKTEIITKDNIGEVREMSEKWFKIAEERGTWDEEDYICTMAAIDNYFFLGFFGILLRTEAGTVAWTCGEKVNDECFCSHIEKAFRDVEGSYAVINRDFARILEKDYQYINREDDAGQEGLRKAKMSYEPAKLIEKYSVMMKK